MKAPEQFGITHGESPGGGPVVFPKPTRGGARSSYDGADTNPGNQRHWANADGLSAKAANSPDVRRKLRNRARLEFDNGGNCKGAIETYAHDLVGTGPRLQLTLPEGSHPDAEKTIERLFHSWCDDKAVNFADKLRVMVESEIRDGESFAVFTENLLVEGLLKFDFRILEAEQVATPFLNPMDPAAVDGIEFDAYGNPAWYHVLKQHPGDLFFNPVAGYTRQKASDCVHWFRPSRAGACRGIPRITPVLNLIAQNRGYASATLGAARLGAHYSGFIETNASPDQGPVRLAEYDEVPVEEAQALTLPAGWKFTQSTPVQPGATHKEFKEGNLTEFGRAIHQPRNVVTGDSSGYNFSSARLDHLISRGAAKIERNRLCVRVLDPTIKGWAGEAVLLRGYIPEEILATLPPVSEWSWCWQFDGWPSINPVDDATANETNLKNGLTTHAVLLAQDGIDWKEHFDSIAEQRAYAKSLGIEDLLYPWLAKAAAPTAQPMQPQRTNEGTRNQPQGHGAEWQSEEDTVIEERSPSYV